MKSRFVATLAVLSMAFASPAFARDAESAKKYVAEATELIDKKEYDNAKSKLDLAEAELDGVDAAAKAPIAAGIETARKQISAVNASADKAKYARELERWMTEAEGAIGNLATWEGTEKKLQEIIDDPAAKAALGADLEAAQKKFATFKKLNAKKVATALQGPLDESVKDLDAALADAKATFAKAGVDDQERNSANQKVESAAASLKRTLERFPKDDVNYAKYQAKLDAATKEMATANAAGDVQSVLDRLNRAWESQNSEETVGWEKETTPIALKDFMSEQSDRTGSLGVKKSADLRGRIDQFMKNRIEDDEFKAVKDDPKIKAFFDDLAKKREGAMKNITTAVESIVAEAEKATVTKDNGSEFGRLGYAVGLAVGQGTPEAQKYQDRLDAKVKAFNDAGNAADAAKTEAVRKMAKVAADKWPELKAKFKVEEGFDPNNFAAFKGKLTRIETDNLMGYRFKPGDFPFASTLNGVPLAGKYEPDVAAAITAIEKTIGRSLGDSDDDGKWEIIARVEGTKGQMQARKKVEGDVNVDGTRAGTVSSEYAESVDAPIITIVAAHCGPLAVVQGVGAVKEDGLIGTLPTDSSPAAAMGATATNPPAPSRPSDADAVSSSGTATADSNAKPANHTLGAATGTAASAWLLLILSLLVGLTAAAAALLTAGYAPLANVPQVGQVHTRLGTTNLAYVGLACAVWGAVWLLLGLIHIHLSLVNLAIIAAGAYAALDLLVSKGIVKPDLAAKIKPLGVPIGLGCAAIVVVGVLLSALGHPWIS